MLRCQAAKERTIQSDHCILTIEAVTECESLMYLIKSSSKAHILQCNFLNFGDFLLNIFLTEIYFLHKYIQYPLPFM